MKRPGQTTGFIVLATLVVLLAGCIDPTSVYFECRIDGDRVRIEGENHVTSNYTPAHDVTTVQTGETGDYQFILVVPGRSTGSWTLEPDSLLTLLIVDRATGAMAVANGPSIPNGAALQVRITSYGRVGGHVAGLFSGVAIQLATGQTISIRDGNFRALIVPGPDPDRPRDP